MVKKLIILGFLLSLVFRFYQFGQLPPGINRDEASLGYTAFSLLRTGRDEYGHRWPLTIKSFGDWKLPGYVYTLIPFVSVFGLQDWVVRLPSALAGLGTIIVVYFLAKEFFTFSDPGSEYACDPGSSLGIVTSLLLALTPWHIHLSRAGYEANLALFFFSLACLLFLQTRLLPAFFFFSLTLYTYHTYHLFTPLFLLCLILIYRKKLIKQKRSFLIASSLFLLFGSIIFSQSLQANLTKASGITFFTDPVFIHNQIDIPRSRIANPWLARLIYNKPVVFSKVLFSNYLASFSPRFLLLRAGSHPVHNVPGIGNLLLVSYLFFFIGLWQLLQTRTEKKSLLLLTCLLISPLASSLTIDAPSSVRLTPMLIPLTLISGLGVKVCWEKIRPKTRRSLFLLVTVIALTLNLLLFARNYFFRLASERAQNWGAGYQELVDYLDQPENRNRAVIMARPHYSPYIYFLFYQQYDPALFQKEAIRYAPTEDGFVHVQSFSRYQFKEFDLEKETVAGKIVVLWAEIVSQEELKLFSPFLQKTITAHNQPLFHVFYKEGQHYTQAN